MIDNEKLAGLDAASVQQGHGDLTFTRLGLARHQVTGLRSGYRADTA
jgi:hypothetical protein